MTDYRFTPRELSNPHLQAWRVTYAVPPHVRLPLRAERRSYERRVKRTTWMGGYVR